MGVGPARRVYPGSIYDSNCIEGPVVRLCFPANPIMWKDSLCDGRLQCCVVCTGPQTRVQGTGAQLSFCMYLVLLPHPCTGFWLVCVPCAALRHAPEEFASVCLPPPPPAPAQARKAQEAARAAAPEEQAAAEAGSSTADAAGPSSSTAAAAANGGASSSRGVAGTTLDDEHAALFEGDDSDEDDDEEMLEDDSDDDLDEQQLQQLEAQLQQKAAVS